MVNGVQGLSSNRTDPLSLVLLCNVYMAHPDAESCYYCGFPLSENVLLSGSVLLSGPAVISSHPRSTQWTDES